MPIRRHQLEHPGEAPLEELDDLQQHGTELLVGLDLLELGDERVEVERVLEGRQDQVVLGVEDPEDRALGDAGGVGDLPGGHGAPVLEQQRDGGVDERCAAVVGREGLGTGWHAST